MTHLNYYLDLCVDTYVVHDGAVLLRLHDKYKYWGAPGGHIDPGEDVNEAALRELWEEAGIKAELVGPAHWVQSNSDTHKDLVPPLFINRHKITDLHDHSSFIFAAKTSSRDINPQTEADIASAAECIWVTREELIALKENDSRLGQNSFRYAMAALDLVSKS